MKLLIAVAILCAVSQTEATACTSHAGCQLTELCSNRVCVATSGLSNCPCTSPLICEYGKCITSPAATTVAPITTTGISTVCTGHAACVLGQLCNGGRCVPTSQLTACPSGSCPSGAGTCEHGYCIQSSSQSPASCLGKDYTAAINNGGNFAYEPISIAIAIVCTLPAKHCEGAGSIILTDMKAEINKIANDSKMGSQQKANSIRAKYLDVHGKVPNTAKTALDGAAVPGFGTIAQLMSCINETKCTQVGLAVASNTTLVEGVKAACSVSGSDCSETEKILHSLIIPQVQATISSSTMTETEKINAVKTTLKQVTSLTGNLSKNLKEVKIDGFGTVSTLLEC